MDQFLIRGGRKADGDVRVHSAKNAVLPLLAASVLTQESVFLENVPHLTDIEAMLGILKKLGCRTAWGDEGVTVWGGTLECGDMPYELCRQIRSSIFLLGPLLARLGKAKVPFPGGCEIGLRPIDLHLKGLKMLGAHIYDGEGKLVCDGENMHAGDVYLDYPSVGATENVMMAAVCLKGVTTIHNAAREPEITDLARFLNRMGARIRGAGTQLVRIEGVEKLHGVSYRPIPDRIVAGTLLCAGAVTGGKVLLRGAKMGDLVPVVSKLRETGCDIRHEDGGILLRAPERLRTFGEIRTNPHPGFPTDMQSQMVALACLSDGVSLVTENVFENRFAHVGDLCMMGADIRVSGRTAIIRGVKTLHGANVAAKDLRGGAALVLAALGARGVSEVSGVHYIDRGYENMETMLCRMNLDVMRVN